MGPNSLMVVYVDPLGTLKPKTPNPKPSDGCTTPSAALMVRRRDLGF